MPQRPQETQEAPGGRRRPLAVQTGLRRAPRGLAARGSPSRRQAVSLASMPAKGHAEISSWSKATACRCRPAATESASGVSSLPTFVFFKGGKEIERFSGADENKLSQLIERLK